MCALGECIYYKKVALRLNGTLIAHSAACLSRMRTRVNLSRVACRPVNLRTEYTNMLKPGQMSCYGIKFLFVSFINGSLHRIRVLEMVHLKLSNFHVKHHDAHPLSRQW